MSLEPLLRLIKLGYNRAIWSIHELLHKEVDICDHFNGEVFDITKMVKGLKHSAPIYETSHVGCYCRLTCYSTTNPDLDHVVIDADGGFAEPTYLDKEDKYDRQKRFYDKFKEYRTKFDELLNNNYITGDYSEPLSGIYSFDFTIFNDKSYQQNTVNDLEDRVLDIILTQAGRYGIKIEDAKASASNYIVTTELNLDDYNWSKEQMMDLEWSLVDRLKYLNELTFELDNLEQWLLQTNSTINDLLLRYETGQSLDTKEPATTYNQPMNDEFDSIETPAPVPEQQYNNDFVDEIAEPNYLDEEEEEIL